MSTNYFLTSAAHPIENGGLHIGKAARGWAFHWRAYPELGLMSRDQWERVLTGGDVAVVDETGELVTFRDFQRVAYRAWRQRTHENALVAQQHLVASHQCSDICVRIHKQEFLDGNDEVFCLYEFE